MGDVGQWMNGSAFAVLAALIYWAVTKGLPGLLDSHSDSLAAARTDYKEESAEQRVAFREEMALQREQSRELATSGQEAVKTLSTSIDRLRKELKREHPPTPEHG